MSARVAALIDAVRCPWSTRGWWLLATAICVGVAVALAVAAVGDVALGPSAAWTAGVASLSGLAAAVAMVATAWTEDRATGIGVHAPEAARLVASWRRARRSRERLAAAGRRLPPGPLSDAVAREAAAMRLHLGKVRTTLAAWWSQARRVDRVERGARGAASSAAQTVQPVVMARREELRRAALAAGDHLDALAASADRLVTEVERRAALDRLLTGIERVEPTPALPERSDTLDPLASALSELAELDTSLVEVLVSDRPRD